MSFYWVVYRKGSFLVKEPHSCPLAAEKRLDMLVAERWFANLISPDPPADMLRLLENCVEIPPPAG